MRILILEDNDERIKQFQRNLCWENNELVVVKEAIYAINYLKNEKWDILFLDHDLGGQVIVDSENENTGAEVARFLKDHLDRIPGLVIIHTSNPDGQKYMKRTLPTSVVIPFAWTKLTLEDIQPNMVWSYIKLAEQQNIQLEYGRL